MSFNNWEKADLGDTDRNNKFLKLMGGKKNKGGLGSSGSSQPPPSTNERPVAGCAERPATSSDSGTEVKSYNEWEKVKLGDDGRTNKFQKLMGLKKGGDKSHAPVTTHPPVDADAVQKKLEEQYNLSMQMKLSGAARRKVGLGFAAEEPTEPTGATGANQDSHVLDYMKSCDAGREKEGKSKEGRDKDHDKEGRDRDRDREGRDRDRDREGRDRDKDKEGRDRDRERQDREREDRQDRERYERDRRDDRRGNYKDRSHTARYRPYSDGDRHRDHRGSHTTPRRSDEHHEHHERHEHHEHHEHRSPQKHHALSISLPPQQQEPPQSGISPPYQPVSPPYPYPGSPCAGTGSTPPDRQLISSYPPPVNQYGGTPDRGVPSSPTLPSFSRPAYLQQSFPMYPPSGSGQ